MDEKMTVMTALCERRQEVESRRVSPNLVNFPGKKRSEPLGCVTGSTCGVAVPAKDRRH